MKLLREDRKQTWAHTAWNVENRASNPFFLSTVPEKVYHIKTKLTADNAVEITCKNQSVFGPRAEFILIWNNDEKPERESKCEFKRENLFYLTNYTFKVSYLIVLKYIKYCCIFTV